MNLFEFTETKIGRIPKDWTVEQVSSLADVDPEALSNKTASDFMFRYISLGDVDAGKLINNNSLITFADAPSRARRIVKLGDVLFATVRPNLKGHFFARNIEGSVVASTGFSVIRAKDGVASPAFLYQSLLSSIVDGQVEKLTTGSNYPAVNSTDVKQLLLPVPPLQEQEKIAAILSTVDKKLDLIERQIQTTQRLKKGLKQTLFTRGFGAPEANGKWIPHREFKSTPSNYIPATWAHRKLGEIAPIIRRPVKIDRESIYPELGLRSYGKGTFHKPALSGGEVGNKRLFQIKAGDLIFSNVFAWEGAVAVARPEDDGRYGSHRYITCAVNTKEAVTDFLFQYLTTPAGITSLTLASPGGAGRNKTLGLGALADITIPLPPLNEQYKISEILSEVDEKLRLLDLKHAAWAALKRGLMQKLLTGEWRVRLDANET